MKMFGIATLQVETTILDPAARDLQQTDSLHTVPHPVDDLREQLRVDAALHRMSGWKVREDGPVVIAAKFRGMTLVTRVIYIVAWDPADDGGGEPTPILRDADVPT